MNHRYIWLLAPLLLITGLGEALGQPQGRPRPAFVAPTQITREEGEQFLDTFRRSGMAGDYAWDFRLIVRPRRGEEMIYQGRIWGTFTPTGPVTRLRIAEPDAEVIDLLLQNGPRPRAWRWDPASGKGEPVDGAALFRPVLASSDYTIFDLIMPFVYWQEWEYEGTARVRGRPAHHFLMYPPAGDPAQDRAGGVRMIIDAAFNALLRAEWVNERGRALRTFSVVSFKKVGEHWIVRTIDLTDPVTRDRTRFDVTAAAVGLELPREIFSPESLGSEPGEPGDTVFERL